MKAVATERVVHIAGLDVVVDGRYRRQRCAWCGDILDDLDLAMINVAVQPGEEPTPPGAWPVGALIAREGPATWVLDEERLPDDSCAAAHPELTRWPA